MLAEEGTTSSARPRTARRRSSWPRSERPDLVILDVKMPVLDGIAAAERIAEAADRPRRHPDRVLPARAGRAGARRRRDGLPREAVHPQPTWCRRSRSRSAGSPSSAPRARGRRPGRAARDPQGGRPGQGRPAEGARTHRAGGVPLDPEDRHGPAPVDARGRRGRRRARRRLTVVGRSDPSGPTRSDSAAMSRHRSKHRRNPVSRGETHPPEVLGCPASRQRRTWVRPGFDGGPSGHQAPPARPRCDRSSRPRAHRVREQHQQHRHGRRQRWLLPPAATTRSASSAPPTGRTARSARTWSAASSSPSTSTTRTTPTARSASRPSTRRVTPTKATPLATQIVQDSSIIGARGSGLLR